MIIYVSDMSKYIKKDTRKNVNDIYDGWIKCPNCGQTTKRTENFRRWDSHFLKNEACPVKVYKQIGKSLDVVEMRDCECWEKVRFNIFDILKDHLKEIFT